MLSLFVSSYSLSDYDKNLYKDSIDTIKRRAQFEQLIRLWNVYYEISNFPKVDKIDHISSEAAD